MIKVPQKIARTLKRGGEGTFIEQHDLGTVGECPVRKVVDLTERRVEKRERVQTPR